MVNKMKFKLDIQFFGGRGAWSGIGTSSSNSGRVMKYKDVTKQFRGFFDDMPPCFPSIFPTAFNKKGTFRPFFVHFLGIVRGKLREDEIIKNGFFMLFGDD